MRLYSQTIIRPEQITSNRLWMRTTTVLSNWRIRSMIWNCLSRGRTTRYTKRSVLLCLIFTAAATPNNYSAAILQIVFFSTLPILFLLLLWTFLSFQQQIFQLWSPFPWMVYIVNIFQCQLSIYFYESCEFLWCWIYVVICMSVQFFFKLWRSLFSRARCTFFTI